MIMTMPMKRALLALLLLAGAPAYAADGKTTDYVDELNFYNTDLHLVLRSLADKTGYPIVEDVPVTGKVTVHISKRTSISDVLDQVLRGLSLSWKLELGVIHVQRRAARDGGRVGGLETRVFSLEAVPAEDAAESVRPLLSENGKLAADRWLNALTVTDLPEILDSVKALLDSLDVEGKRPAQINIQTKVLQIDRNNTDQTFAHISWWKRNAFEALSSQFMPSNQPTLNTNPGWYADERYASLPDTLTFKVGTFGVDEFLVRFIAQNVRGKANVLSEPDVTVLNDTEATIVVGVKLPQVLPGGGFEFQDTGVIVKVKPKLVGDGRIFMELNPKAIEAFGYKNYGRDWLYNREINTQVEMVSGDTIRLGGLIATSNRTAETKIPVLGDLPLLGTLFKRSYVRSDRNELVILISPHIVERIPPRCGATAGISALQASLVVGTTDVLLDWSEDVPYDNVGVVRYHVYRDVRPIMSTTGLIPLSRDVRGDLTSWVDLTPKRRGVSYFYAVTGVDGAGNEQAPSNSPTVTVPKR